MTATVPSTQPSARARTLRDDLLDDLRQAAPMPTAPPAPEMSVPVVSRPVEWMRPPPRRPAPADPGTPALELRVMPQRWWGLRVKTLGEGPGIVVGAGPVQLTLSGFRR